MDNPEMYQNSSLMTKRDAEEILTEYTKKFNWREKGERIIDVACADGGITANICKKYAPNDYKIIGCDINDNMIKFANKHNKDEKTSFMVLDIEKELPNEQRRRYHHVFSFYILHWVRKQRFVFQNFYDLLDEGGQCLVTGLARMPFFEAYRAMARTEKWGRYLKNVEEYVSEYHDCPDPVTKVTKIMEEVGFKNIAVVCKNREFIFESPQALKDLIYAVNAFKIPQEEMGNYLDDIVKITLENNIMELIENKERKTYGICMKYNLTVAFGSK